MTPMIDIVFQLLAFFMFTINFTNTEQDQRVTLPASELAKPTEAPYDHPLTIHLTDRGEFIYAGNALRSLDELRSALLREPPNHRNRSEITMDQHPWSDTWKSYTKSTMTFTASMGQGKHAGMLVSMLSLDYIPEGRATSHTQIQGNFSHALAPGKLPISTIGTFDITFRNVELNGTTVTSTPSKKKTQAHHLQTLLFSTK